jgi:hypothetical protein
MKSIALRHGVILFILLTTFFLLMALIGQSEKVWLRVFNGVIHMAVIFMAILNYRRKSEETLGNYLSGVAIGLYTSVVGAILFGVFMAIYLSFNTSLHSVLVETIPVKENLIPLAAALFIVVEGIATGLIGSYLLTRLVNMKLLKEKTGQVNFNKNYSKSAQYKYKM